MTRQVDKNLYCPADANFHIDKWERPVVTGGFTRLEYVALEIFKASISDGKVDIDRRLDVEIRTAFGRARAFLAHAKQDFEEFGSCMEPPK